VPPRIGVLGGTFDPIHIGHLDLGRAAQDALGLAEVLVVPSNIPPHRPQPLASSYHRFAMVALAIAGRDGWRTSDAELREDRRSYTSLTLQAMHREGIAPRDLVFIIGADAFGEIESWRDYPALFDLATFAVVSRPGHPAAAVRARLPALARRMRDEGSDALAGPDPVIVLIDRPTADVSASAIRHRLLEGAPIEGLVPDTVRQYIARQGLYLDAPRTADAAPGARRAAAGRMHGQE
jgi:nicotinate-nucleotide adenylyltransferase